MTVEAGQLLKQLARHTKQVRVHRTDDALDLPDDLPSDLRDALLDNSADVVAVLRPPPADSHMSGELLRKGGVPYLRYLTSTDDAQEAVRAILSERDGKWLGVDVETVAYVPVRWITVSITAAGTRSKRQPIIGDGAALLDSKRSRPRLFQAYAGGRTVYVFDMDRVDPQALHPLSGTAWVAANAKVEIIRSAQLGLPQPKAWADCLAWMWHVGRWARTGKRSLAAAAELCFSIDVPKGLGGSDWSLECLTREQLEYAALDAVLALRVRDFCERKMADPAQAACQHTYADPALLPIARAETRGIGFDVEHHKKLVSRWRVEEDLLVAELEHEIGSALRTPRDIIRHIEEHAAPEVLAGWRKTPTGLLKTDKGALLRHRHAVPGLGTRLALERQRKLLQAFGENLIARVVDGRLYCEFRVPGARTGRLSSANPNLQQMPKRRSKVFRRSFVARPGCKLIAADYSQMELRAAAEIAQDRAMLAVYEECLDIHTATAAAVTGKAYGAVTEQDRLLAKALNFGLLYGAGARTFDEYAFVEFDLDLGVDRSRTLKNLFFERYHGLAAWQENHTSRSRAAGYVETLGGRRWYWNWSRGEEGSDEIGFRYNYALNHPIQGTTAEIVQKALHLLRDEPVLLQVHDEIVLETPDEDVPRLQEKVRNSMVSAFSDIFPSHPTEQLVDVSVGDNWLDTVKI